MISLESTVDGDLLIIDMTRRNRNFKVIQEKGKSLFVKQVKNFDPQSIASLRSEATSYNLASSDPAFNEIASMMPTLIDFDSKRNILIVELFSNSENISEMHHRLGHIPAQIAKSLGTSLGSYHRNINKSIGNIRAKNIFPEAIPWMLTLNQEFVDHAKRADAVGYQLFSIIEKYPEFLVSIADLRKTWQTNSLIHGDMKWDNCLVVDSAISEQAHLKIIDWELADIGDHAWDIGAVFQTFLSLWVFSLSHSGNNGQAISNMADLPALQPSIKHFWIAYKRTLGLDESVEAELLQKCMKYCAIRMIQTVYEQTFFTKNLSSAAIILLQLSLNSLKHPDEAIQALLGL